MMVNMAVIVKNTNSGMSINDGKCVFIKTRVSNKNIKRVRNKKSKI